MNLSSALALCLTTFLCFIGRAEGETQRPEKITWEELPVIPNSPGLSGAFAGVSNGALIVAGGSNFPQTPEGKAESRFWYADIYVLSDAEQEGWQTGFSLKEPLAYGASVISSQSLILIGGSNAEGNHKQVTQITWEAASRKINQVSLPPLPQALSFVGAAEMDEIVYVAGVQIVGERSELINIFWSLNLNNLEAGWESLKPWEGPVRKSAVVVGQNTGYRKNLYIIGGEAQIEDEKGEIQTRQLTDGYRYSLTNEKWERITDAPHPLTAAPGIAYGQSHVLIFGGKTDNNTGMNLSTKGDDHPLYSHDLLVYHTITDTWLIQAEIPLGVVSAEAVSWGEGIVLTGGETEPGTMTPKVQLMIHDSGAGASFGIINYTFLTLYLVGIVYLGFYFSKREKGTDDYFLAGRRIPWWAAGLSLLGTGLSAVTYIAHPALTFSTDWFYFPVRIGFFFAPIMIIYFYLPFYRRLNITTAYEYLEKRFNLSVRLFGSAQFILFQSLRISLIMYLPAIVLTTITGINIYVCILSLGLISTFYTVLGGIEAVIWSDVIQVFIFIAGLIIALVVVFFNVDNGVKGMIDIGLADDKYRMWYLDWDITEPTLWVLLISGAMGTFIVYSSDQSRIQRFLTTKDEKAAAKGLWLNVIAGLPLGAIVLVMGSALYAFYKTHPTSVSLGMRNDAIFPLFIAQNLPFGLAGFVIAAIFSAAMSSLDSGMNSIATVFVTDFYRRFKTDKSERFYLNLARSITLLIGIFATAVALLLVTFNIQSAVIFASSVLGLFIGGLGGLFALGIFTRRANGMGAMMGAIISAIALYYVKYHTPINFFLYPTIGFTVCLVTGYLASLIIPERKKSLEGLTIYTVLPRRDQ